MSHVVVITGMSGAGRSVAGDTLEDMGWFVIDNLPADLVSKVGELASSTSGYEQVVLVMAGFSESLGHLESLRSEVTALKIVFLEASTDALVRRYEQTRRRHPLAEDGGSLVDAIERERRLLSTLRSSADLVIDTSDLNPHQLRDRITSFFDDSSADDALRIMVSSFGFKHGLPLDVDLVFDCRFLQNPNWIDELRPLSGKDAPIQRFVLDREVTAEFLDRLDAMLEVLLPAYAEQGKSYLSIAFGCTGGRHRSVAMAEAMSRRLTERGWRPRVSHRDIDRESTT
ncbi:MAG: RNase adapter RapZ [Actinomycetota bacterium]